MNQRLIIDTSVFLSYAAFGKLYRLFNAIERYELTVFVDEILISEIERNLIKVMRLQDTKSATILKQITEATAPIKTISLFGGCPDEKDNFLFDLAIQSRSDAIVTIEKALLNWQLSPVPVYDIKWFKESFPVAL